MEVRTLLTFRLLIFEVIKIHVEGNGVVKFADKHHSDCQIWLVYIGSKYVWTYTMGILNMSGLDRFLVFRVHFKQVSLYIPIYECMSFFYRTQKNWV